MSYAFQKLKVMTNEYTNMNASLGRITFLAFHKLSIKLFHFRNCLMFTIPYLEIYYILNYEIYNILYITYVLFLLLFAIFVLEKTV